MSTYLKFLKFNNHMYIYFQLNEIVHWLWHRPAYSNWPENMTQQIKWPGVQTTDQLNDIQLMMNETDKY